MKDRQITIRESPTTRKAIKRPGTSKEIQPKTQKVINDVERLPSLRTRMSPSGLYNFVKENPSNEQLEAIKNIGFGGLLQIQTDTIPGQLAYWLASSFDPYKCSLMDEQLPIQDVDIHIALGIPIGPRVVNEAIHNDKSEEFAREVEKWQLQYEKDKKIETKGIIAKMKQQRDGGEDFKRNFIVYIVSTFLGGLKSSIASLKILKTLTNVDDIPHYNWFFKSRTVPRTFPTISSWSKESINDRIKEEKKFTKTFGKGFVDSRMTIEEENANDKPTSSSHQPPEENERAKMCVEKLVLAAKKLASSFEEFKYAANEAIHELPDSSAVSKMVSIADAMAGGFISSQNDENKGCIDKNDKGKEKMYPSEDEYEDEELEKNDKQNVGDEQPNENEKQNDPWDDESFWGNEKILEALFTLNDALQPLPPSKQKLNKRKKVKKPRDPDMPRYRLLDSDDSLLDSSQNVSSPTIIPAEQPPRSIDTQKPQPSNLLNTPKNQPISIIIESTPPPVATVPSEEMVCLQIPKRHREVAAVYKSPYLQRNVDVLLDLTAVEKEVADYSFSDSVDQSLIVYESGNNVLLYADIRSLLSAKISDNVFNCWCEILNKNECLRSPNSPYRLFLSRTSKKLGKPELLAKQLRVKYCHAILTSDLNSMKEEVLKNATSFKETKTVIGRHISSVTDQELIDYVMAVNKDNGDVIIDSEWMQVTRKGLQTMQPGVWLSDMAIDIAGIYGTLHKPGVLYFPTIIKDLPTKKNLKTQYIKFNYFPKDLRKIQKVFFPILCNNHWYAMISDFNNKKNCILDSLLPRYPKSRIDFTSKLMSNAIPVITQNTTLKIFSEILDFDYEALKVPPQMNG
ncbi:hypothetical protein RND81_01G098400 [Saponaria officinalis]|uniref:Ubiquitin-like protease family profile domain-containing protein n=1 Tax=Saponaria officinalis TaxID=3572 RepID=A0AAW1NFS2_SAPOF